MAKTSEPSSFEPSFEPELLGLKFELIETLGEAGFPWFEAFETVEVDISNAEFKVYLKVEFEGEVRKVISQFARANGFGNVYYSSDKGCVYIRRR